MTLANSLRLCAGLALALLVSATYGHDLSADNARYVQGLDGAAAGPFLYLGAKHMFTGYDHLLFLLGVIFFLYRARDILLYVTLFTIGHSLTLMLGVWADWRVSGHLVDAIIGLSIVYKAFENMGASRPCSDLNPIPGLLYSYSASATAWAWLPSYRSM